MRALHSGLDLDIDEVRSETADVACEAVAALVQGTPPLGTVGAVFSEGLIIGLLIAEARAKAEAS